MEFEKGDSFTDPEEKDVLATVVLETNEENRNRKYHVVENIEGEGWVDRWEDEDFLHNLKYQGKYENLNILEKKFGWS